MAGARSPQHPQKVLRKGKRGTSWTEIYDRSGNYLCEIGKIFFKYDFAELQKVVKGFRRPDDFLQLPESRG
jgi:hypothetical protein